MKLTIEINNAEVRAYFERRITEGLTVEQVTEEVLEMGVAVLERARVSRDVEFVKKETERMIADFNRRIEALGESVQKDVSERVAAQLDPGITDSYSEKMIRYLRDRINEFQSNMNTSVDSVRKISDDKLERIREGIERAGDHFNPDLNNSYLGRVRTMFEELEQSLHKQLDDTHTTSFAYRLKTDALEYFGENSPIIIAINDSLEHYTQQFRNEVVLLRETIAEKEGKQKMMSKASSTKGAEFEEEVLLERLEELARPHEDTVESIGRTAESGTRDKKGDYIYSLRSGESIVIEAKDEKLGLTEALRYMNQMMEVRNIDFSIIVYRYDEQVPKQAQPFSFYDNNKIVTSFEYVELAIRWSRLYLTKVRVSSVEELSKDTVLTAMQTIGKKVEEMKAIRQKLTALQNSVNDNVESVRKLLDGMQDEIRSTIEEVEQQLGVGRERGLRGTYLGRPDVQSDGQSPGLFS